MTFLQCSVRFSIHSTAAVVLSVLGLTLGGSSAAWANSTHVAETELAQVTSDSPATLYPSLDVPPDHWASEAVRSLITNYGCLAGYPDGTFRGDQTLTRNEFAAGMNSCLDVISGLVQEQQQANAAEREQLIQSMQELQNDLDELEGRVGL
ncbi:MAG TPA: S-layer homology domain-containing protein [Trichocoleus sp.]